MRTPLSILVDEADRLRRQGHTTEAQTILDEARIMQHQIDFHLARARQAAAHPVPGQVVRLGAILERLIEAFARLYRQRRIEFGLDPGEDVDVACDPIDLTEILSNLLDNAGKWAATRCQVRWYRQAGNVVIEIADDGPGLPEGTHAAVFKVGTRLDDLAPGSGLGLAISRDLAEIHGGEVVLETAPSGGVLAIVRLPIA